MPTRGLGFDAVASYQWSKVEVQLNLNNLTNALYYAQYYSGHAVPAVQVSGQAAPLAGHSSG